METIRKKIALLTPLLSAFALIFTACGAGGGVKVPTDTVMPKTAYYDQLTEGKEYNRELFFQNDLSELAADPSVIYITEGDEAGWFYMYATSDQIGAFGYQGWRSRDLSRWECTGVAFLPDRDAWARYLYWAPEVFFKDGIYYMFYNAQNAERSDHKHCIGLATATSPKGPFTAYAGTNGNGDVFGVRTPLIDSSRFPDGSGIKNAPLIDSSPYYDAEGGKFYLYFTLDIQNGFAATSSIWGMEMLDFYTPKYETVRQLTEFNRKTVGGSAIGESVMGTNNKTNEAPFVRKYGGQYYLTFSTSQYDRMSYSVCQATGDTPLGPFTKIDHGKGGVLLTALDPFNTDYNYDHMTGTGHHSFVPVGDELFIAYHAFVDRYNGSIGKGRAIAVDRVFTVNNGEQDILYVNGPSYSIQPLPAEKSGYANLAAKAAVTATNVAENSDKKYLTDGLYKNHSYEFIKEAEFSQNNTEITFTFSKEVSVRAVMVYNAFDYGHSFEQIESIAFKTKIEKDGKTLLDGLARINGLGFDLKKHVWVNQWDTDGWDVINDKAYVYAEGDLIMRPGGSATAEFDEIRTTQITVKVKSARKGGAAGTLNISDIVILGKE